MRYKNLEYTTVSELIQLLQDFADKDPKFANMPVAVEGNTPVYVTPEPYFYDGGYLIEDVEPQHDESTYVHYVRSKTIMKFDPESPFGFALHIRSKTAFSDKGDTVDGKTENCHD